MPHSKDQLETTARHIGEQCELIEKQIQLLEGMSEEGGPADRQEAILRALQQATDEMRRHLEELLLEPKDRRS